MYLGITRRRRRKLYGDSRQRISQVSLRPDSISALPLAGAGHHADPGRGGAVQLVHGDQVHGLEVHVARSSLGARAARGRGGGGVEEWVGWNCIEVGIVGREVVWYWWMFFALN